MWVSTGILRVEHSVSFSALGAVIRLSRQYKAALTKAESGPDRWLEKHMFRKYFDSMAV